MKHGHVYLGWSLTCRLSAFEPEAPGPRRYVRRGGAFREQMSLPKSPSSLCYGERSRTIHHQPRRRLTWTRAWKTAFASAPMRSGPHMVACTAKPSSTGLRPNGKCWRRRRPSSPANQIRRRSHGQPRVRRPPERSRGPISLLMSQDYFHHLQPSHAPMAAAEVGLRYLVSATAPIPSWRAAVGSHRGRAHGRIPSPWPVNLKLGLSSVGNRTELGRLVIIKFRWELSRATPNASQTRQRRTAPRGRCLRSRGHRHHDRGV
jgi:hypothetical protein